MKKYLCNKCYYVELSDKMPELCPVCNADVSLFSEVVPVSSVYIPEYWNEHIERKIEKIHENQIKAGRRGFSFGLISDIHWGQNEKHSAAILEKVMNACDVPYAFNAGDTVSGAGLCPPEAIISDILDYKNSFARLESRMIMAQGNHDPSYSTLGGKMYYRESLTTPQVFEYLYRHNTKYQDRQMSEDGTYYYVDMLPFKARLIVLNPYNVPSDEVLETGEAKYSKMSMIGYRQKQLEWFANEALDVTSSDWTVVLCTHTNPVSNEPALNDNALLDIINAFRKGEKVHVASDFGDDYGIDLTADFSNKQANFAVWVSGHTHNDRAGTYNDTLCLSIISDWNHNHAKLDFERSSGAVAEQAFDIYTVSPDEHKIYITRVGAGEDREFLYI